MVNVIKTDAFHRWMKSLADQRAKARIVMRIDRLAEGNAGDFAPVGEGVCELRIDYGPGYRVYYLRRGEALLLLLCGGDKSTQPGDIRKALQIARDWKDG